MAVTVLGAQRTGKRRRDLKAAFLREVHGCVDIALSPAQLHALDVLEHLTIFKAFVLGGVFLWAVFARRRNHFDYLSDMIITS